MKKKELTIEEAFKKLSQEERRKHMEAVFAELLEEGGVRDEDFPDYNRTLSSEEKLIEKALAEMIDPNYTNLYESFVNRSSTKYHFNKHNNAGKYKATAGRKAVLYDFSTIEEYQAYEEQIGKKCRFTEPDFEFTDITDLEQIEKAFSILTEANTIVQIPPELGLKNNKGEIVQYFFLSSSVAIDNHRNEPTIDFVVRNISNRITATLYPIRLGEVKSKIFNLNK